MELTSLKTIKKALVEFCGSSTATNDVLVQLQSQQFIWVRTLWLPESKNRAAEFSASDSVNVSNHLSSLSVNNAHSASLELNNIMMFNIILKLGLVDNDGSS